MKKTLLLFIAFTLFSKIGSAQGLNCANFCVLSIGNIDTVNNEMDVTIYNGDTNSVNYPTIVVVDALGDTIANKTNYFYLFLHPAGDTITQTIPAYVDSLPTGFTGTIYFTDQVWDTTCSFSYPMSCSVGINEQLANTSSLLIYPVPVSTTINIYLGESIKRSTRITLFDTTGKAVKELTSNNRNISIDRGNLRGGIYFVSIETEGNRITKKIILE